MIILLFGSIGERFYLNCLAFLFDIEINAGPWSKEETERLIKAVEEIIQERAMKEDSDSLLLENSEETLSVEREKLYKNLPWIEIQTKVGTRHWRQCKSRW